MKTRLLNLWEKLRTSFWPIPGGITAGAAALAFVTVAIDRKLEGGAFEDIRWLAQASAPGVRALLSTVASAMLTTAGVVFSVTIVALTMASSQFGPRLLRNFISARSTQIVLGALLGTFLFCLLILRYVHASGEEHPAFIPHFSVITALALTVLTLALFIYFIHAIAVSLQADRVVSDVNAELTENIDRFCPPESARDESGECDTAGGEPSTFDLGDDSERVTAQRDGYLQAVDVETLLETACRLDLRMQVVCSPGHFLHSGGELIKVAGGPPGDEDTAVIRRCFLIGSTRTPEQDFEFCIRQLVEIALRALSPGINDPFTATTCIDYLGAALGRVAGRCLPLCEIKDEEGEARIALWPITFDHLLESAFSQLRRHTGGHLVVSVCLLDALGRVAAQTHTAAQAEAVRMHARLTATECLESVHAEHDRRQIEKKIETIDAILSTRGGNGGQRP